MDREQSKRCPPFAAKDLGLAATTALVLAYSAIAFAIPTVYVEPAFKSVEPDEPFQLQVMINADADTISNFRIIFEFDPGILQFVDAHEGSLYANCGHQTWFQVEEESLGTWEVFDVIFPAGTFVLPPGELTRLEFRAIGGGYSLIEFLVVDVKDVLRYPIEPLTSEDGVVYVGPPGTGVAQRGEPLTRDWSIGAPFPNPSRGPLVIPIGGPQTTCDAEVTVFDAGGRLVRRLRLIGPADGSLSWDGLDGRGHPVPAGAYFVRLAAPGVSCTRRVIRVR